MTCVVTVTALTADVTLGVMVSVVTLVTGYMAYSDTES